MILALYTAELISTILQEKVPLGMNIRGVVNSGVPFSVVDGGPSQQMAFEYPTIRIRPSTKFGATSERFSDCSCCTNRVKCLRAACDRSPACLEPSTESHIPWLSDQVSNIRNYEHLLYANIRLRCNGGHHADVDRSKNYM
jgi:hypothetical protein